MLVFYLFVLDILDVVIVSRGGEHWVKLRVEYLVKVCEKVVHSVIVFYVQE